jgi:hypothetical protein
MDSELLESLPQQSAFAEHMLPFFFSPCKLRRALDKGSTLSALATKITLVSLGF